MTTGELRTIAEANGLLLTDTMTALLLQYAELLIEKNQHLNLISRKDIDNVLERHILHSLSIAMPSVVPESLTLNALVLDVGTGGGLPGIPLAIVRTDLRIVLCDSIQKKIAAVNEFIHDLGLKNVTAVCARTEMLAAHKEYKQRFDHIISRAAAPLVDLINWTKDVRRRGASLLALKGGDLYEEISSAQKNSSVMHVAEIPLTLAGYDGFARDEKKLVRVTFR